MNQMTEVHNRESLNLSELRRNTRAFLAYRTRCARESAHRRENTRCNHHSRSPSMSAVPSHPKSNWDHQRRSRRGEPNAPALQNCGRTSNEGALSDLVDTSFLTTEAINFRFNEHVMTVSVGRLRRAGFTAQLHSEHLLLTVLQAEPGCLDQCVLDTLTPMSSTPYRPWSLVRSLLVATWTMVIVCTTIGTANLL